MLDAEGRSKLLNFINTVMGHATRDGGRWFFSFGTLLYFIRDLKLGKELEGDFDISVMDKDVNLDEFVANMESYSFKLNSRIIDDKTKKPYQMVFESTFAELKGVEIDIFIWKRVGNLYWHTYDYRMERPSNGIPSRYVFKATPTEPLRGDPVQYIWEEMAMPVNFPRSYGTLLDIWYPGWFIPDRGFGQSRSVREVTVKTCKKLDKALA